MKRIATVVRLALVGLIVSGIACRPRTGGHVAVRDDGPNTLPAVAFQGDSRALKHSVVVPTLDTPLVKGKNLIWCASFQLAWDRLKDEVGGEPVCVADAEAVVKRLNHSAVSTDDLPEDGYYAAAGAAKDGIVEKIRAAMQERFHKEPTELNCMGGDLMAYAYLQAALRFTLPYFENDESFVFTDSQGRKTAVSSFGLREKDESKYSDLRRQPEVLYANARIPVVQPAEFALDLCRESTPCQVIVARIPRKETLLATIEDLDARISGYRPDDWARQLHANSVLLVPNLHWSLSHHFSELEGPDKQLLNKGLQGLHLATALQTIDFRLDRSGVELQSESHEICKSSDPCFVFDGPFLIVVKNRGARHPFFVMWVDNAELLSHP
jgi:hypothetical protein